MNKITLINNVLQNYFDQNKNITLVPAKELMPHFIKAGIFPCDKKNGLPIREILRKLDRLRQLNLIPFVHADRKAKNTTWYFSGTTNIPSIVHVEKANPIPKSVSRKIVSRKDSDEHYVIDMCDKALRRIAVRQHHFEFLLGDANAKGVCSRLPVDAYYPELNLVIEYKEQQHIRAIKHFDKPDKLTVSGVHRGEQRKSYDQRRLNILPKHGIRVIEIHFDVFNCSTSNKIIRNQESDLKRLKAYLKTQKLIV